MLKTFFDTHPIGHIFNLGRKKVVWKKAIEIKKGMKIAVINSSNDTVEFDEIISIKKVGRQKVYDIEVEGTHNFVGNGIIAHNTKIDSLSLSATGDISSLSTELSDISQDVSNKIASQSSILEQGILQLANLEARLTLLESQKAPAPSPVEFSLNTTFRAMVEFFENVVFHGQAKFDQSPILSKDTLGVAIISTYSDEVRVVFDKPYEKPPIVTFTMTTEATESSFLEEGQKAYSTHVTNEGFTIKLPILAIRDYTYNWIAFASDSVKVTKSTSVLQNIMEQVAGVATESAGISP